MGMLSIYKCVKCKKSLQAIDSNILIGEPFLICEKCGMINEITRNRNEYDLLNSSQRLRVNIIFWLQVSLLGWSIGLFVAALILYSGVHLSTKQMLWAFSPIGFALTYWYFSKKRSAQIGESRKRMSDPQYIESLKKIGIIK